MENVSKKDVMHKAIDLINKIRAKIGDEEYLRLVYEQTKLSDDNVSEKLRNRIDTMV